ncbi:gp16 family protein [Epibacterium ulvae]|uniref:gp16 family protein n=1 Tax=Epibacterium ulvae TaxID=1156985 RepID=UPI0024904262|nr:regulatory protein GemA [Epibacterium ulvae]
MSHALRKKIHMGCRQLGLDTDARKALQLQVTGKSSTSDMSDGDMRLVIKRLEQDGFKPTSKGGKKHGLAPRRDVRLIHKLWSTLGEAGVLEDPSRAGLNAFIRKTFGKTWGNVPLDVDSLNDRKEISDVINALKDWGRRKGVDFDWGRH